MCSHPFSWTKLSQFMVPDRRNSQKFSPLKVSHYTVFACTINTCSCMISTCTLRPRCTFGGCVHSQCKGHGQRCYDSISLPVEPLELWRRQQRREEREREREREDERCKHYNANIPPVKSANHFTCACTGRCTLCIIFYIQKTNTYTVCTIIILYTT